MLLRRTVRAFDSEIVLISLQADKTASNPRRVVNKSTMMMIPSQNSMHQIFSPVRLLLTDAKTGFGRSITLT